MHFVAILYDKTARSFESTPSTIILRGYHPKTWIPPELAHVKLPVYALAYAPCLTNRDIYLERIESIDIPFTWSRYKGRIIDDIYKIIHKICSEYVRQHRTSAFNLYNELIYNQDAIIAKVKKERKKDFNNIETPPVPTEIEIFYDSLKKIIRFEGELTSAMINFEIARNRSANPLHIFQDIFNFNTDYSLNPRHQGFQSPATPDFVFRHQIIGDIKSGTWRRFFEYTAVAYALAYEDYTSRNMDYGVILNVELPKSRLVPVHYDCSIEYLDDRKRERFLALRNRKLEIIDAKKDPGKPDHKECDPECPFLNHCWGKGD